MATAVQSGILASSRLSSFSSLTAASSVSTSTSVQCKAWPSTRQLKSLSIRATTSAEKPAPASGQSGVEVPLGGNVSSAPVAQKDVPKAERIAYVCQACGYIYDLDLPFEEQPDTYNCPVCTAPKGEFLASNATLGEGVFDPTKKKDASAN